MAKTNQALWALMLQAWHAIETYNKRRVSQAEFAELSGVSRQYLYDLRAGKIVPTDKRIDSLAEAWGVSPTVLRNKLGAR